MLRARTLSLLAIGTVASACWDFGYESAEGGSGGAGTTSTAIGSTSTLVSTASSTAVSTTSTGTGGAATGCGDGVVEAGQEQCDDGDDVDGNGCDTNCTFTGCGNGIETTNEECDDGNDVPGDGCDSACGDEGGGGGGGGGGPPCGGADPLEDEANCGRCGFTCDDEECSAGRCGQSITLGGEGQLRAVLVAGETIYVVRQNASDQGGRMYTMPDHFRADSPLGLDVEVDNAVGSFSLGSVGDKRVYFHGQVAKIVYACDASTCTPVDLATSVAQINAVAAAGSTLFITNVGPDLVQSYEIGLSGEPGTDETLRVEEHEATGVGLREMAYVPALDALFWMSVGPDGCLYRASPSELPFVGVRPCHSEVFNTQGFTVAPDGTAFMLEGESVVVRVPAGGGPRTTFVEGVKQPIGFSEGLLYATEADGENRLRAYDAAGEQVGETDAHASKPYTLDASHPDYVFYTVGDTLYRWPKPTD